MLRVSECSLLFSVLSMTWRWPTEFAGLHALIMAHMGFFVVTWIQSGCTSPRWDVSHIFSHHYQILKSQFHHSILLHSTDLVFMQGVFSPLYSLLYLLFIHQIFFWEESQALRPTSFNPLGTVLPPTEIPVAFSSLLIASDYIPLYLMQICFIFYHQAVGLFFRPKV